MLGDPGRHPVRQPAEIVEIAAIQREHDQLLGPAAAGILTQSVVVEEIFGIPGLGRFFVEGALNRDYTLVMGVVIFYAALIIVFNLAVDLFYGWLDPRVRFG